METIKSTIQVIATAVEKDTENLRQLLIRNGVAAQKATKDQLQTLLTDALAKSESFRKEFVDWVMERSGFSSYANSSGPDTMNTFGGLYFGPTVAGESPAVPGGTSGSSGTDQKTGGGFFSGVTLNSLLDFAKDGLNNYTDIVKSKTDKAIVDAAIEKERLAQATANPTPVTGNSGTTWKYIGITVLVAGVIGGIVYFATKK